MNDYEKQQRISTALIIFFTLVIVFLVSGCSTTVPVKAKFPEAPERLLAKCPQLEKLGKDFATVYKEDVFANPNLETQGKDKFKAPDRYDPNK